MSRLSLLLLSRPLCVGGRAAAVSSSCLRPLLTPSWSSSPSPSPSPPLLPLRPLSISSSRLETFRVQDEEDFREKVLDNPDPVIVDFNATWCGPCKILGPRLDAAVAATAGKVHLALVDIDELSDLALEHGVHAVPTVVTIKEGKEVDRIIGLMEEDRLGAFVDRAKGDAADTT